MATMALPIRELELSVSVGTDKARAETECVVFYSRARAIQPSIAVTFKLGFTAALLKFMLRSLVRQQRLLITVYQDTDFTRYRIDEISRSAQYMDMVVEKGRSVLEKLSKSGPRAKALWGVSLSQLSDQLDHIESIAQSLHIAADPEASLLLGLAVEQVAAD